MLQKRNVFTLLVALTFVLATLVFVGCGVKKTSDPLSATDFKISEMSSLHDGSGTARTTYYYGESIFLSVDKLYPNEQTLVRVRKNDATDCSCERCYGSFVVFTDAQGKITNLELWHNVGINSANGQLANYAGNYTVQILQTSSTQPWMNYRIPFKVENEMPYKVRPFIYNMRANYYFAGTGAYVGDKIMVGGDGFASSSRIRLVVVNHQTSWNVDDVYNDVTGSVEEIMTSYRNGSITPHVTVWNSAVAGNYDIIADFAPYGKYNVGDCVDNTVTAGLLVQTAASLNNIVTELACDAMGVFQNQFQPTDAIWARALPGARPAGLTTMGNKCRASIYVMGHKDVWNLGDKLTHIETVGGVVSAIGAPVDYSSGAVALTPVRGATTLETREPVRLWPGKYDMIIDINNNGTYEPGTDLLDGGSQIGFTVLGEVPAVKLIFCAAPDFDFSGTQNLTAQVLKGDNTPIVGAVVSFSIGKGPGSVAPTSGTTDAVGLTGTTVSGSQKGQLTLVKAQVTVDGKTYEAWVTVYGYDCLVHNQGVLITN